MLSEIKETIFIVETAHSTENLLKKSSAYHEGLEFIVVQYQNPSKILKDYKIDSNQLGKADNSCEQ